MGELDALGGDLGIDFGALAGALGAPPPSATAVADAPPEAPIAPPPDASTFDFDATGVLGAAAAADYGPPPFDTGAADAALPAGNGPVGTDAWSMANDCVANAAWQTMQAQHPDELAQITGSLAAGQPATLPGGDQMAPLAPDEEAFVQQQPPDKQDQARFEIALTNYAANGHYDPTTGNVTSALDGDPSKGTLEDVGVSTEAAAKAYGQLGLAFYDPGQLQAGVDQQISAHQGGPMPKVEDMYAQGLQQQLAEKGSPLVVVIASGTQPLDLPPGVPNPGLDPQVLNHAIAIDSIANGQVQYRDRDGEHSVSTEHFGQILRLESVTVGSGGGSYSQGTGRTRSR